MSGFQRPGSRSQSAFGIAFDSNRSHDPDASKQSRRSNGKEGAQRDSNRVHADRVNAAAPAANARAGDALPVAAYKRHILYLIETHPTLIVLGETGSGKTTQIPQYLLEAGWAADGYQIACTQPRRAAAVTVAARVAEELGQQLGATVGYAVRFESCETKGQTQVKYLTDGVLIREMMEDPLLSRYSVVMVDEAHERSLATDMLLGLLKKVQRRRPDLRLVVSSATLQAELLRDFFAGGGGGMRKALQSAQGQRQGQSCLGLPSNPDPAILSIEGRTHPVEVHYLEEATSDYVRAAVSTAVDIHKADLPGDILIFLTGQEECIAAVRMLDDEAERLNKSSGYGLKMLPLPLYAGLPGGEQRLALASTPRGHRKIIVATNIAETSLTLEGVVYVVDSCFVKQRCYNPLLGLEALLIAPTSKASAVQRAGRAGRVRPGKCFRLTTHSAYESELPTVTVPEMQRSDVTGMVLQLKALGIDNIMKFEWLAPPPAETMVRALENLHALGVLDDDARLTRSIGLPLSELPVEPHLGRVLLASAAPGTDASGSKGCSQEVVVLVALLSVPHLWTASRGAHRAQDEARAKFAAAEGDLITMLNVWRAWHERGRDHRWAARHFLNQQSLLKAQEIQHQLLSHLRRLGLPVTSCNGDVDVVRKTIVEGMFINAACYDRIEYNPLASTSDPGINVYRLVRPLPKGHQGARLRIHNSSVLFRSRPSCVVFNSVQQTDDGWYEMQGVTAVLPEWLTEVAPHMYTRQ